MKSMRLTVFYLSVIMIISSCQQEPENIETEASGTLVKSATGDCAPVTITGTYVQNTTLGTTNFIEVQVDFTAPGDYTIQSDTVNGYSFKATGVANTTGVQTIKLIGSGTPVTASSDVFEISFDNSVCLAIVTVSAGNAVYTFGSAAGNCTGFTLAGSYITGVPLTTANKVTVEVNVTTPGSYSITTDVVNGVSFSKSGTFTAPGTQTLELTGNGTPVTSGPFSYLTAATGGCTLTVTYTNPAGSLATLVTASVSSMTCTGAISGGDITNDGGSPVTVRGICYGTSLNPTTANTVVTSGTGTGVFSANMTGLTAGTTYHVRAFATNSAGTAYGSDISFTTATGCVTKIFVTGRHDVFDISGNVPTPTVWTNTTGAYTNAALPFTPNMPAEANGITVSGTDVYVAGKENGKATIWKNGVVTSLSAPPAAPFFYEGRANAVFVTGTDVYVAGVYANNATVWKNGVATTVGTSTFQSNATSVFVSGSDVYVAGYNAEMVGGNMMNIATVWKNGIAIPLSNGATDAVANAVFVFGSDVYAVGNDGNAARIWKNGVASPLPVAPGNRGYANGIFVTGTDVYVAGTEDVGTTPQSYTKLWKNGVGSELTPAETHNRGYAVFVDGADVFVAGSKSTGGANTRAGVWRNGFFTPLASGSTDSYAHGIVVTH